MSKPPPYDPFGQQPPPQFPDGQFPNAQFPTPGGYYVPPQYDPRYGIRPPQTSTLAVLSLVGGIVSLLSCLILCCVLFSPIVFATSVTSVVLGHLALGQIHRSLGTVVGREIAWVGLGVSYPAAVISGCVLVFVVGVMIQGAMSGAANKVAQAIAVPGEFELDEAKRKVSQASEGETLGNSPQAIELAKKFSERLRQHRDKLASERPGLGPKADDGEFTTWCEINGDRRTFLVEVPSYMNFTSEGKIQIEKLAWSAAQEVLRETDTPGGTKLAVGSKGVFLWGSIQIGKSVAADSEANGIDEAGENPELLYPFFAPQQDEAEAKE